MKNKIELLFLAALLPIIYSTFFEKSNLLMKISVSTLTLVFIFAAYLKNKK